MMAADAGRDASLGRYVMFDEIAAGGMATVHLGRLLGPVGFAKTVAIKRLHPHLAKDPDFATMFLDEARLAARVRHPNVVSILDVVQLETELFLVLDYVEGESLSRVLRAARKRKEVAPLAVAVAVIEGSLQGLHAAHEAVDEHGRPLGLVHRDVSPQNIQIGVDGIARVLDFGVAKAAGRLQETQGREVKGKLAYMAPEQLAGGEVDRRTDVYAAGVCLWETLTGRRLVKAPNEGQTVAMVMSGQFAVPSAHRSEVPAELDAVTMKALNKDPTQRFASAREFAMALTRALSSASVYQVGEWVEAHADEALAMRKSRVKEMESSSMVRAIPAGLEQPIVFAGSGGIAPVPPSAPPPGTGSVVTASGVISTSGLSQLSYSSASHIGPAQQQEPKRNRGLIVLASLSSLVLVGAAVALAVTLLKPSPESEPLTTSPNGGDELREPEANAAPPSVPPTATAAAEAPAAEPGATPVGPDSADTIDVADLPAAKTKRPAAKAQPTPAARPKQPPKPDAKKSSTKKAANCASPFYVDKNGIKHVRPECM